MRTYKYPCIFNLLNGDFGFHDRIPKLINDLRDEKFSAKGISLNQK